MLIVKILLPIFFFVVGAIFASFGNMLMYCRRQYQWKQVLVSSAQFPLLKIGGCDDYFREPKTV